MSDRQLVTIRFYAMPDDELLATTAVPDECTKIAIPLDATYCTVEVAGEQ